MKRIMIQADDGLLERARTTAAERGVSVAQLFRDALERDLGIERRPAPPTIIGTVSSTSGDLSRRAAGDEYEPEPYR